MTADDAANAEPTRAIAARTPTMSEQLLSSSGLRQASNINMASRVGKVVSFGLEASEQVSIFKKGVTAIECAYVLVREGESFDKDTGEVMSSLRSIFIAPDGQVFGTNSPIVARVALRIIQLRENAGPFDPPIKLTFGRVDTRSGGTALTLTVDMESARPYLGL